MRINLAVFRLLPALAAAATLALTIACSGSDSSDNNGNPSGPTGTTGSSTSSSSCRTYATAANVVVQPGAPAFNTTLTGSFNTSTNQTTITQTSALGTCTIVASYSSRADFVDEVRVVPPIMLLTTNVNSGGGVCAQGTVTNTFDSQRRITRQTNSVGGTTTYTAWDSAGRPTAGTFSTGGTIAIVNNESARTQTSTTVINGQTTVSTTTFDANGMITSVVVANATTTTYTATSTAQVCK